MVTSGDLWAMLVLPALVTLVVWIAGWRFTRRRLAASDSRSWAGPLAVGAGFMAGYSLLFGRPQFPPADAAEWLFYLAVPLLGIGLLISVYRLGTELRALLTSFAVLGSLSLLVPPGGPGSNWRLAAVVAVAIGSIVAFDLVSAHWTAARTSAVLVAVCAPSMLAVVLIGASQRLGFIGGLLLATQAGGWLAGVTLGRAATARGVACVVGTLLAGLLACGHWYAELSAGDALLLALAPQAAWLGQLIPRRFGRLARPAVEVALVLAVASVPLVRNWIESAAGPT